MGIITEIGEKSKLEPKKEETDLYLKKIYEEKLLTSLPSCVL